MAGPYALFWKIRLIELVVYFIVLLTVFVLSFFPLSNHKAYKISIQVVIGLTLSLSLSGLLTVAESMRNGRSGVVVVTHRLIWPKDV